ncbi:hypothetical protein [Burkholderia vietnamiensis]|uniref:hypothetical protein n=1 Tax=Burkholderia vietnamiensis TaxID=60552 RepID=UPI001CF2C3E7|nr:hypothetical protein [Burkholderia vietnamiensis]MCA8287656.1 hypothetical protein [Burkholderia vietnamiensis]
MDADLNDVLDCADGRFPYPDACVKLVMGLERNPRAAIPRMAAMVIVSTKDELAEITFETYSPDYARHTVSSLPDVRRQVQQLQGLDAQRQGGCLLRKLRSPYMVTFRWTMGVLHRRFMLTFSPEDAYRGQVPEPYAGAVIPLSVLENLLAQMERVKTGEEKAPYAWDYSEGGDFFRSLDRWSQEQPPEFHAWKKRKLEELAPYMTIRPGDPSPSETTGATDLDPSA